MSNIRPIAAPDIMATFAGFSACYDRILGDPVSISPTSVGPVYRPNTGKRWTESEDVILVRMYAAGASYSHMGREVGRTGSACQSRLYFIGYGRAG